MITEMNKQNPIILSITSGKGGVGKTSISVNLAFALTGKDYRVLLIDGDLGLANVDILLGITAQTSIRDVLDKGADPLEAIIYLENNLGILPAGSGVPEMANLEPEQQEHLGKILTEIASHFDYVLIDTAAGIGSSVLWLNHFAEYNIVVLTPDPTSLTDAYAIIKTLVATFDRTLFYMVLNLIKDANEAKKAYETLEKAAKRFLNLELQYLGAIPEDKVIKDAVRKQAPFIQKTPQGNAAKAVMVLADRIEKLKSG